MNTLLALFLAAPSRAAEPVPLEKLMRADRVERMAADMKAVETYRNGLQRAVELARTRPKVFKSKEKLEGLWKPFLDYLLALDSMGLYYAGFHRLGKEESPTALNIAYAAFLARTRGSMELILLAKDDLGLSSELNEPVPELGLGAGAFDQLRFRCLSDLRPVEFAAYAAVFQGLGGGVSTALSKAMAEDYGFIKGYLPNQGAEVPFKNGLALLKKTGFDAWFPAAPGASGGTGRPQPHRRGRPSISRAQAQGELERLEPGDILLVRKEWRLSGIGLPGFWTEAALYVGTPEERKRFFDDPEVRSWVKGQRIGDGNLESLLSFKSPDAHSLSRGQIRGFDVRVVEASEEAVGMVSLEEALSADSAAGLRPRTSKREKAEALLRAFGAVGRPYDYFPAEIVSKAYAGSAFKPPTADILGRQVLTPNLLARRFDEKGGASDGGLDFVFFLDGEGARSGAREAGPGAFRKTWRRPKWRLERR
jgi:hypothetical protein